jgi:hypothetical protein
MDQIHARNNRIFALLVFAVAFVVFILTAAPTVAFWDCGEYVAAGSSLGIPHPPGNPLFMMMLRVASIAFSFVQDVGFRMNILVVLMSALTAVFMYLTAVRAGIAMMGVPDTTWKRIALYTGGIVGGCFAVFGTTFWFSAVEQSEANPIMMFLAFSTWLSLVWAQSKDPNRDKFLILLVFTSFLGIAVHMYSMIILPPLFLFVMIIDKEKRVDWRLWLTVIALGIVVKDLSLFIFTGLGAVLVTFIFSLVEGSHQKKWRFCFLLSLVALLGFSAHIYLPIRSAENPMIDENHPATWEAFDQFLERKQYGDQDMISRMFWRRGSLAHQFGIEERMGYGGFHITQFFHISKDDAKKNFFDAGVLPGFSKLIIYLLPTLLMMYGWYYLYKKNKKIGMFLLLLFLLTSVGLVFYMNFADGTRPEQAEYDYWVKAGQQGQMPVVHREVRVRDYFYAAAFMYFGMWIGIAAIAALHTLFLHKDKFLRTAVAPILAILFMVSPALPITQNWKDISRSGDWVPYDYAYNLLNSCEKNAILFTNGDNDTFPLWALQEAYGIRKDVRIINLSLVNTSWYILQMKNLEPKVPISFTDDQIKRLDASLNPIEVPTRYTLPEAGITVTLPSRNEMRVLRAQDQMVINVVDANKWKKPIYFVTSASDGDLMGLGPFLKLEGMVYRVTPHEVPESEKIDVARSAHLLNDVYRYTNLENGKANLTGTSEDLLTNYEACFIQVALALRSPAVMLKNELSLLQSKQDTSEATQKIILEKKKAYQDTLNLAVTMLDRCKSIVPLDWRPRVLLHEILVENGMLKEAEKRMREALTLDPGNAEYQKRLAEVASNKAESADLLKKNIDQSDEWEVYKTLSDNYTSRGLTDSAVGVLQDFLATHPGDKRAADAIVSLKK